MVSGRPSSRRPEREPPFQGGRSAPTIHRATASRAGIRAAALTAALALAACGQAADGRRATAFKERLATIDRSLSGGDPKAIDKSFSKAYGKAGRATDWLSLLKRAETAADPGAKARRAEAARRAIAAFPRSESLRAASGHAYLRSGMPREALALFGEHMAPDARPELWAEAFLSSSGNTGAGARAADYARLADALGDPRPYAGAAVASLAAGDRLAASAWLRKALEGGARVEPELLWDCGLYEELSSGADYSSDPAELELMGDAAWKTGDIEQARRRWSKAIAIGPRASWRPYANLALLSGSDGDQAESYWARLKAAFLSGPPSRELDEALASYASHLARAGKTKEAAKLLAGETASGRLAVLKLSVGSESMPEGRYAIELERLAAERDKDPAVMEAALRELARRGLYAEAELLREGAARRKLPLARGWFYAAAAAAARGDYSRAASIIGSEADGTATPEGLFALGSLHSAMEDYELAAEEFSGAAALAPPGRDRCAALKAMGRALAASGDPAGSMRAYKRALAADPADPEAAILARGRGK